MTGMLAVAQRAVQAILGHYTATEPVSVWVHRRYKDPAPGKVVAVVRSHHDWGTTKAHGMTLPALQVLIYAAPAQGQDDAHKIAGAAGERVRKILHKPDSQVRLEGHGTMLNPTCVGRSVSTPEGQPDWALVILDFELKWTEEIVEVTGEDA